MEPRLFFTDTDTVADAGEDSAPVLEFKFKSMKLYWVTFHQPDCALKGCGGCKPGRYWRSVAKLKGS